MWFRVPGSLKQVSVGRRFTSLDTQVWGVNSQNQIWRWPVGPYDFNSNNWELIAGELKRISVASSAPAAYPKPVVWGVNSADEIYRWRGGDSRGNNWERIAGSLADIVVGSKDVVGFNGAGELYKWRGGTTTGNAWIKVVVPGPITGIALGETEPLVYAVQPGGEIWFTSSLNWQVMPSGFVTFDGDPQWLPVIGSLVQISASVSGHVCGVDAFGKAWWLSNLLDEQNPATPGAAPNWYWTELSSYPTSPSIQFKQISVGDDYDYTAQSGPPFFWAVDVQDGIWRWVEFF